MGEEWCIDRTIEDPTERERTRDKLLKRARRRVAEHNIEPGDEEEIEAQIAALVKERERAARRVGKLERKLPRDRTMPFLARYRRQIFIVSTCTMITVSLSCLILGALWIGGWLLTIGIVLTNLTILAAGILYSEVNLVPSKNEQERMEFDEQVIKHDEMTAEIRAWRELAVRIGGASGIGGSNPTARSLQRIIDDPHTPPDMRLEAKQRLYMYEDEP